MATAELTKPDTSTIAPITFEVTKEEIEKLTQEHLQLVVRDVNDKPGLDACHAARMGWVKLRNRIDRRRKELGEEARQRINTVNTQAKELIELFAPTENYLQTQEDIVAREQERLHQEEEARLKAMVNERLRQLQECGVLMPVEEVAAMTSGQWAVRILKEQQAKEERDKAAAAEKLEQERIFAQQRDEQLKLAEERRELDRQRAEAETRNKRALARITTLSELAFAHSNSADTLADMPPEQWEQLAETARNAKAVHDKAAAERKAELDRREQEQAAAQAKIDTENKRIADEQAEKERIAELERFKAEAAEQARLDAIAEQKRKEAEAAAEAAAAEAELRRLESLRPDNVKLLAVALAVEQIELPPMSDGAHAAAQQVTELLQACVTGIRNVATGLVAKKPRKKA